ncbi:MAG: hypothetical protein DDT19_01097 [Syntrophomonadaceae bacterium]|nr:hypothetical protein [Bacillota bacterium]
MRGTSGQGGGAGDLKQNDFSRDLQYSLDQRECEWFDSFYYRIFPGLDRIELVEDMARQKQGVDKILHFKSGYKVTIDEKKRREDYGDIALETWSIWENRKRGWLYYCKCDYVVYAIMPAQIAYLLPVLLLKRAWHEHGKVWLQKYKEFSSYNPGYTTKNIAVPVDVLLGAIAAEMKHKVCLTR